MKKIAVIFGTRPEAIKLAPVILALKADPGFDCRVCVTAQHREMLDQVLDFFEIKPDYDLNLMSERQTLPSLTAWVITSFTDVLVHARPDVVLVQGDTTTAMASALENFSGRVPVGHVV